MIYITYIQNSGGRSGHKLCEIFTCFLFSCMFNVKVLYNSSWNKQMIISNNSLKIHSDTFNGKFDKIERINTIRKWECLSWNDFLDLKKKIDQINNTDNENVLFELSNVFKIHPHIIYDWYVKKYINEDTYHARVLPKLRELYFYDHKEKTIDCISIHIRCGDLYKELLKVGFTLNYYTKLIQTLNSKFDIKINIYYENENHEEFYQLEKLKNVELFVGGVTDIETHFNNMVNSKVLILSASSMSMFASYLCKGLVLIDNKCIKVRPNVYNNYNCDLIEKFDDISVKIDMIKVALE